MINMNQFVLGFAIARPLAEQRDRLMIALTASMFPASNPYGAIFLKPQVDALADKESRLASLTASSGEAEALLSLKEATVQVGGILEVPLNVAAVDSATPDLPEKVEVKFDKDTRKLIIKGIADGRANIEIKIGSRAGRFPVSVVRKTA